MDRVQFFSKFKGIRSTWAGIHNELYINGIIISYTELISLDNYLEIYNKYKEKTE